MNQLLLSVSKDKIPLLVQTNVVYFIPCFSREHPLHGPISRSYLLHLTERNHSIVIIWFLRIKSHVAQANVFYSIPCSSKEQPSHMALFVSCTAINLRNKITVAIIWFLWAKSHFWHKQMWFISSHVLLWNTIHAWLDM